MRITATPSDRYNCRIIFHKPRVGTGIGIGKSTKHKNVSNKSSQSEPVTYSSLRRAEQTPSAVGRRSLRGSRYRTSPLNLERIWVYSMRGASISDFFPKNSDFFPISLSYQATCDTSRCDETRVFYGEITRFTISNLNPCRDPI